MGDVGIAVVGGGTMGLAIVEGALASGGFDAEKWIVAEPDAGRHAAFEALGVRCLGSAAELAGTLGPDDQLLLATKPQSLVDVASELESVGMDRVVISILAGTPSSKLREALGGHGRIVRVMPNTPARIGRATSAIAVGEGAIQADALVAERIFGAVGKIVRLDESLMDAFTAVAGSGPAYLFYLAEAMVEGAKRAGIDADVAREIVASTLAGAGELLGLAAEDPSELRQAVTSRGGTTAAATKVLDDAGVMKAVERAVVAARDRGRELADPG